MKQNLVKAVCPVCKKRIKLASGHWRGMGKINKKALPPNLLEEHCPSCLFDEINRISKLANQRMAQSI